MAAKKGQWLPHRTPTDQQAEAFRRWLQQQTVEVGPRIVVAGIAWTWTAEKDIPDGPAQ